MIAVKEVSVDEISESVLTARINAAVEKVQAIQGQLGNLNCVDADGNRLDVNQWAQWRQSAKFALRCALKEVADLKEERKSFIDKQKADAVIRKGGRVTNENVLIRRQLRRWADIYGRFLADPESYGMAAKRATAELFEFCEDSGLWGKDGTT